MVKPLAGEPAGWDDATRAFEPIRQQAILPWRVRLPTSPSAFVRRADCDPDQWLRDASLGNSLCRD